MSGARPASLAPRRYAYKNDEYSPDSEMDLFSSPGREHCSAVLDAAITRAFRIEILRGTAVIRLTCDSLPTLGERCCSPIKAGVAIAAS